MNRKLHGACQVSFLLLFKHPCLHITPLSPPGCMKYPTTITTTNQFLKSLNFGNHTEVSNEVGTDTCEL